MQKNIDEKNVRSLLRDANGVTVVDHRADEGYVTPEEWLVKTMFTLVESEKILQ